MIIKNGVLESIDEEDIVNGNCVIPDSVTEIEEEAFSECSSLTQIKIPSSDTFLDPSAFDECENIYIEIPQDASLDFKIMMFESIGYDTENDKKMLKYYMEI